MNSGEIASRLRQELAKKADSLRLFQPRFGSIPTNESPQAARFFFDKEEIPQRIRLIRENVPTFEATVLQRAEQILNHQFSLLGYGPLDYGQNIDWQLDIVSGKRSPLIPWPKIKYLNFNEIGDSKVTWELSRHQYLVTLAKAWLLTGDDHFVSKLASLYYDWHKKNPYPLGINWASSLEVAFRSLSWIWVEKLLACCESARQLRHDIRRALAFNAWYLRRYLSTYFSPNTHLQGEAVALFFIGTLFPSLPNASDWRNIGRNILMEHAYTKVLQDGAYFEQSTYYHVYALDFFLHAEVLATRNDLPFPESFDDVMKGMLQYLACLCQAGPPPRFGDDDGGRVFDGQRNRAEHLFDPLAIGTALYGLPELKRAGVKATEELLWILGEDGLRGLAAYPARKECKSTGFSQTGLYVSLAKENCQSQLALDAGPLGGGSGGHGHADALSLTVNVDGKPLLVDPGACNYSDHGSEREYFRETQAHNTATVDGLSQAEPQTAFSWSRWPEVRVEAIAFTSEFDFISASHDGYSRLENPATHRRTLFALRQDFWVVLDELISDGPHDYALHWHFGPGSNVSQNSDDGWVVKLDGSSLHLLNASDGWNCTAGPGWFSPVYGKKEEAPILKFTKSSRGAETFATVLFTGPPDIPAPTLTALNSSAGMPAFSLTIGTNRSILVFGDGITKLKTEGWESDAKFLCGTLDADNCPSRIVSVDSNFVRYDGKTIHESTDRVAHFVWPEISPA